MASLNSTNGKVDGASKHCVVSFSATLGQAAWNNMVSGETNFACVWTGRNNSPKREWYDPWVKNVDKAASMGMTLVVIGHVDHPRSQFTSKRGEKFYLGDGQLAELQYIHSRGYKYKYVTPIHFPDQNPGGFFDRFTWDGPIKA